jgi:hypothetical protein
MHTTQNSTKQTKPTKAPSTIGIWLFVECIFRALGKEVFAERRTWQSPTLGYNHVYWDQDARTGRHSTKIVPSVKHSTNGDARQRVVSSRL